MGHTAPVRRDLLRPRPWLVATAAVLVLLALTGWWQSTHYRPEYPAYSSDAPQRWEDIYTLQLARGSTGDGAGWVSDAHRALALVLVPAVLGLVAAVVRRCWRSADVVALGAVGTVALVSLLALRSAHDLPFDQLGLWAVTVGTDLRGVWRAAFSDQVRFVLADGERSQREYATDVVGHVLAVPAVLAVALGLLALRLRRR
jgi:quinol-cytochrome oxidoreductase complex cytochrome b subunit